MKSIHFRPLRRIKKTGKIAVASYMQWYKVKCADYNKFNLSIDEEYKFLPRDEYVYNHKGEPLFWRDYNPADIPVYSSEVLSMTNNFLENGRSEMDSIGMQWDELYKNNPKTGFAILSSGYSPNYHCKGLDCCGTPTFSHGTENGVSHSNMVLYTLENIHEQLDPMQDYEPLTVGMVSKWFGWFIYQLQNSELKTPCC